MIMFWAPEKGAKDLDESPAIRSRTETSVRAGSAPGPHGNYLQGAQEPELMDATAMLDEFCRAVERRDGSAVAALFTEDGVYHDEFYGRFRGARQDRRTGR